MTTTALETTAPETVTAAEAPTMGEHALYGVIFRHGGIYITPDREDMVDMVDFAGERVRQVIGGDTRGGIEAAARVLTALERMLG